jgi:hypothetical protein
VTKHLLPPTYTYSAAVIAELTRAQMGVDGVRITRGAYVSRAVPLTAPYVVRAALDVLPEDGTAASHRTAAVLQGAPLAFSRPLEFTVPPGIYRPRRKGIRIHVRDLADTDRVMVSGIPVTSGAQTWLDLASVLPPDELVAVGDALYRERHLDAAILTERLDRATGTRGAVLARRLAPLLTPLAASRPESLFRYWLVDSDLPDPQPQVPVLDRWGRAALHADLGYEEWKVAIEYEGRQHAEVDQFGRDLDRYSLMAAGGWLLLRFGARHLYRRPVVVERVAAALRSRGARW